MTHSDKLAETWEEWGAFSDSQFVTSRELRSTDAGVSEV